MTEQVLCAAARYTLLAIYAVERGSPTPEKPADITWEQVFYTANRHTLAGALFHAVDEAKDIPEALRAHWERTAMSDIAKDMNQRAAYSEMEKLFCENAVPYLLLKGFIVKDVWTHPEYRPMSDIDVYVSEEYVHKAKDLLLAVGYTFAGEEAVHISVKKPPYVNIELHKFLYRGSKTSFSDFHKSPDNPYKYEMNHTDFLVFYIGHAEKHYRHGGCGIRTVLDLEFYLEKYKDEIDADMLNAAIEKAGFFDFFALMRRLADAWLRGAELNSQDSAAASYIISGGIYGTAANRFYYNKKNGGGIRYIFKLMFPPYLSMANKYPILNKCKLLLPVCYVHRMIASLFNGKAKKVTVNMGKANAKLREDKTK